MNKNKFLIALLAMFATFAMFFAGCDSDNEEEAIKKENPGGIEEFGCKLLNNREINKDGGTFYWAVKASDAWTLDADLLSEWLTIEPLEGKAGTTAVILVVTELPDDKERAMELPFVLSGKEVKITVKQTLEGGKDEETEEPVCRFAENKVFGKDGGSLTCILETSADWTLSEEVDWLTVSPMEGKAGQTQLTMTAEASGGILRMALLTFELDGEMAELVISQNLNDSRPALTLSQEADVVGNYVTMYGHCAFENDEVALEKVGFAYRVDGTTDAWTYLPSDSEITYGAFDFAAKGQLRWGKTYAYVPYAKLNGKIYEGEGGTFTIEDRDTEDGVWYYENFDGMYDPNTKEYTQAAITKGYKYGSGELSLFDASGGFLRHNQPNAKYKSVKFDGKTEYFRLNPCSGGNDGRISAQIKPDDIKSDWNLPEGTQLYPGASGNWKYHVHYEQGTSLTITDLDFIGAGKLQLTFGCSDLDYPTVSGLTYGILEVYTSVDGEKWNKWSFANVSLNPPVSARWYWKQLMIKNIPENITGIRFVMPKSNRMAIDDIKVVAQP